MPHTPNIAEPMKLRHRWFRFGLRTLLIAVVGLSILCAGYAAYIRKCRELELREQAEARALKVEWLEETFSRGGLREGAYDDSAASPPAKPDR